MGSGDTYFFVWIVSAHLLEFYMATVNNDIYQTLGDRWYDACDDPVALLRAESRLRGPWILERLNPGSTVLDVGCGAGFLTNFLSEKGFSVT